MSRSAFEFAESKQHQGAALSPWIRRIPMGMSGVHGCTQEHPGAHRMQRMVQGCTGVLERTWSTL